MVRAGAETEPLDHASGGRWVVPVLLGLNVARLAVAPAFELVPQEAYYFLYSRHLALSYFDHPPVLACLLRLFTTVFGAHELSLRLCAFSLSVGMQLCWLRLARRISGARYQAAALWLLPTGIISLTTLISTPDVPLLLFWTLSLLQLHAALFDERKISWVWAGLSMGLAFDSKYTGALLQIGLLSFLLISPAHRRLLKSPWPWTALSIAQLISAPVYIWNAQHHFASFLYQTADRFARIHGFAGRYTLGLLATQAALVGVPLLGLSIALASRPARLFRAWPERAFLACFFIPTFAGFFLISIFALVKPNWMMPAYLTGALLVADLVGTRWLKANLVFSAVVHLLAILELLLYPVPIRSDDTWVGWKALATEVQRRVENRPGSFVASADGYKTTAELRFYSSLEVYGPNVVGDPGLQFDYIDPPPSTLRGRDALFIDSAPNDFAPGRGQAVPGSVADHFAASKEEDPILITDRGRIVRKFRVYRCRGYRP